MTKTITQIQKDSDTKRGIAKKGYSLPITTIEKIKLLSDQTGIAQGQIIAQAVEALEQILKKPD